MIISIHQPNYIPWLGYFHKIKCSDHIVFLDDVQYSKNNYINRSKILSSSKKPKWISIPVSFKFKDNIYDVFTSKNDWIEKHLNIIENYYKKSLYFDLVWPDIKKIYNKLDNDMNLSLINSTIIIEFMSLLSIKTKYSFSSKYNINNKSDMRLIEIVKKIDKNAIYLSGKGGSKYQDENKFIKNNIILQYINFDHPTYSQLSEKFFAGLSILDCVFNVGWKKASTLI